MRPSACTAFLAIACAAGLAHATSMLGMRYPLGIPSQPNSGMSMSMGGAAAGVANDNNLILRNPANLGNVKKTVFSSLFMLDFTNIQDEEAGSYTNHARFLPRQITFGFPLGILGSVAASFEKRQEAYARFEFAPVPFDPGYGELDSYQQKYSREGGETAWQIAWAHAIGRWVRLGLAYERVYARLQESRSVLLTSSYSSAYADSSIVDFRGNGLRAGVQVPVWHLTLGLAGQYCFAGDATVSEGGYVRRPTSSTLQASRFTLRLPPSLTAGIAWQIDPRWLTAFDVDMTMWGAYDSEDKLLAGDLRAAATGLDLGVQFVPAPDQLTPKYWETICYRAGARYTQMPCKTAYELAAVLGFGLPLPAGGGLLDIVFEYGRRLDQDYPRYTEELFRIGFGVSGGRKWAKSPQSTY